MKKAFNRENIITLSLWFILCTACMVLMLQAAAHKSVLIVDAASEQREEQLSYDKEYLSKQELLLTVDELAQQNEIYIPLEKGTKVENVVTENHYLSQELWIYLKDADQGFYESNSISGDRECLILGNLVKQKSGVLLKLKMSGVFEYESSLTENQLKITCINPKDIYKNIIVLDPLLAQETNKGDGKAKEQAEISLKIATLVIQEMKQPNIKLYLTRTDEHSITDEEKVAFLETLDADGYIGIGVADEPKDLEQYGIFALYDDEYFIPSFGNVELSDALTREITKATSNKAIGLIQAQEDNVLKRIHTPAAQIFVGYFSNKEEQKLLLQDTYQQKIATGITRAITEGYLDE